MLTLQLPGLIKKDRQIFIFTKVKISPIISLGVLCDDGFTSTLDKQDMSVQKTGQETIKGNRKKKTGMRGFTLETQQSEAVANKILP